MFEVMLLGNKGNKYPLPHSICIWFNPQHFVVLHHVLFVKLVSEALITRDCVQVALEVAVKQCIHIAPITGSASARKYTSEVREA